MKVYAFHFQIIFLLNTIHFCFHQYGFSQSGEWAWMKGDTTYYAPPVWGTKGVADPANNPPRKYTYFDWQDTSGNFWIYSGLTDYNPFYQGYNDLWKFDIALNSWIWMHGDSTLNSPPVFGVQGISSPANTPGFSFFSGLSWTDLNGNFWLYGGCNCGPDLWKYDPTINEWAWMQGSLSISPVYGTFQVPSASNTPGTIQQCNSSWVDDNNNLWFYGGQDASSLSGTLWKYDMGLNQWAWMGGTTATSAPAVYGTFGVPDPANFPGERWCYASWKDEDNNFMLFGGRMFSPLLWDSCLNDLWKYDLATGEWTWVSGTSLFNAAGNAGNSCQFASNTFPAARYDNRAVAVDTCGNVWMYGGFHGSSNGLSDLWVYRFSTNDWAWISGSLAVNQPAVYGTMGLPAITNHPGYRAGAELWIDKNDHLWLFGGTSNNAHYAQDLWKYIPDSVCQSKSCLSTQVVNFSLVEGLSIFPNPASEEITLQLESNTRHIISITNTLGEILFQTETNSSTLQLDVSHFTAGVYFVTVKDEKGNGVTKKVVKM